MKANLLTQQMEAAVLKMAASIRGRKGGIATSQKKAKTSAKNGRLGGRPRKLAAA